MGDARRPDARTPASSQTGRGTPPQAGPDESAGAKTSRLRLLLLLVALVLTAIFVWYVVVYRQSVSYQARQLRNPDVVARIQAIRKLHDMNEKARRVIPALVEALSDEEVPVRSQAAMILRQIGSGDERTVPLVMNFVQRPDVLPAGRLLAINLLAELGDSASQAVPMLVGLARGNEEPRIRQMAMLAAYRIAPEDAGLTDVVFEAFGDADAVIRSTAAGIAAKQAQASEDVMHRIMEQFRSEEAQRRVTAVVALRSMGVTRERVLPVLIEALTDRNKGVRETALASLVGAANSKGALRQIRLAAAVLDAPTRRALEKKLAEVEKRLLLR